MKTGKGAGAADRVEGRARGRGGRVHRQYRRALNGFAAQLSDDALADVRADPDIAFVEPDAIVSMSETQSSATWGLDRIDQTDLPLNASYNYSATGAGVTAYIIDTGIRTTHAQFGGRATSGYDAVDGGAADDCNGHGTHVAGTVGGSTYGVAKQVALVAVRVLDCGGSGSTSGVVQGIDRGTGNHGAGTPAVANMSLGGGASTSLDTAVRNSIADGVTYAIAAGNDNTNACNSSPARTAEALTVGSTRRPGRSRAPVPARRTGCCTRPRPRVTRHRRRRRSHRARRTARRRATTRPRSRSVPARRTRRSSVRTPPPVCGRPARRRANAVPSPMARTHGTLSGSGAAVSLPSASGYVTTRSGTHRACLRGPSGTDFDLHLYKRSFSGSWTRVARSEGSSSTENITYNGTAGTYYVRVFSYRGAGVYQAGITAP